MVAPSVTIYKIYAIKICITLSLTFRLVQNQMKIWKSNPKHDYLIDGNTVLVVMFTIFVTIYEYIFKLFF